MSQTVEQAFTPKSGVPAMTAAGFTPEWIAAVRSAIVTDQHEVRPGPRNTIEVLSLRGGGWQPLNLPNNQTHFETPEERNQILACLTCLSKNT